MKSRINYQFHKGYFGEMISISPFLIDSAEMAVRVADPGFLALRNTKLLHYRVNKPL